MALLVALRRRSNSVEIPMRIISRRSVPGGLALVVRSHPVGAAIAESPGLTQRRRCWPDALCYVTKGLGKRASVLVLHGARGVLKPGAYEHYANALTAEDIDAYLFRYYSPADDLALENLD
jgi:hypothetical protein